MNKDKAMDLVSNSILIFAALLFFSTVIAVFVVENKKMEVAKACTDMGGIAVKQVDTGHTICLDPSVVKKP